MNFEKKWKNNSSRDFDKNLQSFLLSLLGSFLTISLYLTFSYYLFKRSGGMEPEFSFGEFVFPDSSQRDENWLKKTIPQEEIEKKIEEWIVSWKYLPYFNIGNKPTENRHLLLYGSPGSGKSYFAEQFAKNESLAYIFVKFGSEIWKGSAQRKINKVAEQAEEILKEERKKNGQNEIKPVVIIIDEIDSIGIKNFSENNNSDNDSTNGLLTLIDKLNQFWLNIIIIGITNYSQVLEEALIRSGRLGNQIKFNNMMSGNQTKKLIEKLAEKNQSLGVGIYKCQENKSGWKKNDPKKNWSVEWNDFWLKMEQKTIELIQEFQENDSEQELFSWIDIKKAFEFSLAKSFIEKKGEIEGEENLVETNEIEIKLSPQIADYEKHLREIIRIKRESEKYKKKQSVNFSTAKELFEAFRSFPADH